ncbi:oxaloacetate decarboxylase [Altererythrobacter sp. MF3-039]|uniref:isocitrate lyase/PEP mutase family protein n=1 Tax=Altererythrobacter sp. MF3-039 TaxID=3252901 RepID=UPI00390CA5E5
MKQAEAYEAFKSLHEAEGAFVMANAWDAASAVVLRDSGFKALGSSSAAIAYAIAKPDGAHAVSREEAIENAALLGRASNLPINGDLEDGFGPSPEECVATVEASIAAGLAGLGIEDTTADPGSPIHDYDTAVRRIEAAAKAASGRILLTGRTDLLLHGSTELDEVIRRLVAFADAGADVLYAPALPDMDAIRKAVAAVAPKPVNVLIGPKSGLVPLEELSSSGVSRVSIGGGFYGSAMGHLGRAGEQVLAGDLGAAVEGRTQINFNKTFGGS